MEGQQLLPYLQGNIFLTNANVYTIPHSFCAATKTIPDRGFCLLIRTVISVQFLGRSETAPRLSRK